MRTGITLFVILSFCLSGYAVETASISSPAAPKVFQTTGETEAILLPTKFPVFTSYTSDNAACGNYLCTAWDGTLNASNVSTSGLSQAPLWAKSKFTNKGNRLSGPVDFSDVPGLYQTITIPEAYRAKGRVMIVWTIRVEGYPEIVNPTNYSGVSETAAGGYDPWPNICSPWHGTLYQRFTGGEVKAALYMREQGKGWNKTGLEAVMDIPTGSDTEVERAVKRIHDPTQSGSFLITADDFSEGKLPASLDVKIMWYNDTCMEIRSAAGMRSMTVLLTPQ